MDLISIIVPVYNVEHYIDKCVESIVNQTYKNLDIILVDDGSTDSSPQKCDAWAKKDSRIRVIHKENGGVSSARNSGLKIATGSYIGFVDSDDYVNPKMYEIMESNMQVHNADVVICGNNRIGKNDTLLGSDSIDDKVVVTKYGVPPYNIDEKLEVCCVWNKLYKMSVIKKEKIYFDERFSVGEDFLFNYYYLKYTERIVVIGNTLYNYVNVRGNSAMSSINADFLNRWMVYKIMLENEADNHDVYVHCLGVYSNQLLICLRQLLKSGSKELIENNYKKIVAEISLYYSKFKQLQSLKVINKLVLFFIRYFPGGFKALYVIYIKIKNGAKI